MASQKYHVLKEYANGVMDEKGRFFPYKTTNVDTSAKKHIRYYVKGIVFTLAKAGASAALSNDVQVTIKGVTNYLGYINTPETFVASNDCSAMYVPCGVLCDIGTIINVTASSIVVYYAEIEENEGEYSG